MLVLLTRSALTVAIPLLLASFALGACSSNVATASGSTGGSTGSSSSGITPTSIDCTNTPCPAGMICVFSAPPPVGEECFAPDPDGGAPCPPGWTPCAQFTPDCVAGESACIPAGVCVEGPTGCSTCGCFGSDPCAVAWHNTCDSVGSSPPTVVCM